MKCQECKGACCEVFELPYTDIQPPGADEFRWITLHGPTIIEPITSEAFIRFECKCNALADDGLCTIYDERPNVCQDMPVGGLDCLGYVRDRRTPEQYKLIRDDDDPQTIHEGVH